MSRAAGVVTIMTTLEDFLATCFTGRADVPDVAALCQQYAQKMRDAGFGDTQSLLTMDDDDLKEVSSELRSAGIPPGHVMAIRTKIKSKRLSVDGRPSGGDASGLGGSDGGRGGGSGAIGACTGAAAGAATPLAARPSATATASESREDVYISHVRDRFAQLTEILLTKPEAKATIPSDDGKEPRLGKGLASNQWKVRWNDRTHVIVPVLTTLVVPLFPCGRPASPMSSTDASSASSMSPSISCATCFPAASSSDVSGRTPPRRITTCGAPTP